MDNTIRSNKFCIIGNPACDVVFASMRSCFIAYGFERSSLEVDIVKNILAQHMYKGEEAGGTLKPGHFAFCTKICSQIISSQFCIVFLNHDLIKGKQIPNANVNMEYGLMLGFNKYVIPFQKEDENLPFNVSTLDTIKYNSRNFKSLATKAILQAIQECQVSTTSQSPPTEKINRFLISKELLVAPRDNIGEVNLSRLGEPLQFVLMNNFVGNKISYLGVFTHLNVEEIRWRIKKLREILSSRFSDIALQAHLSAGGINPVALEYAKRLLDNVKILVIVNDTQFADMLIEKKPKSHQIPLEVYTMDEVESV